MDKKFKTFTKFLKRILNIEPREPQWQDFLIIYNNGTVRFDYAGWWKTEPGKREQAKRLAACEPLANQIKKNGSVTIYD